MEKEQEQNLKDNKKSSEQDNEPQVSSDKKKDVEEKEIKELSPEEKISELEDKLTRTFAEMENQRRRFEKEREEAFDYGGYSFAKEALSLIDNLERSKVVLESDDTLKNTDALKKTLEHFDIIINNI